MINKDHILDKIYDKFDREIKGERLGRVKKIMMGMNSYRVDVDYLIGILTVTLSIKSKLGDVREIFRNRTDIQCTRMGVDDRETLFERL